MRNNRISALLATTALASATLLGGAGIASAQSSSSDEVPTVVDSASIVMKAKGSDDDGADGRYTMTATAYDNCTVAFELTNDWPEGYTPNWRADYRIGEEDPVMVGSSRGEGTWRPVLGTNPATEAAIEGRDNPYDFDTNTATVDLTESRTVPKFDDPNLVTVLPGVEPNEDGTHEITFGVYQGPNSSASNEYSFDTKVTVEGCETIEDEVDENNGGLLGSVVGSLDVFGSLEGMS